MPSPTRHRIALVLVAVVCLTSFLSYYQEGQSAKVMNSFKVRTRDTHTRTPMPRSPSLTPHQ